MRFQTPLSSTAATAVLLVLACTDLNQPHTTGELALAFTLQANATAPLDAMTVNIAGPTNTSIDLVQSGGFWEGTAEDLLVGTYTLTAIGRGQGEVTYYGTQSNVTVTADQTTDANVPIVEFIPTITSIQPGSPTRLMTFDVEFTGVTGATTYRVEWESGATGGFVNTTETSAQLPVTVLGQIEFKVRAGNSVVDPEDAQESDPQFVTTEADGAGKDQASAANVGSGAGTNVTLTDLNIAPATEEDWFEVNVVGGERLSIAVRTASLARPSALVARIELYDFSGTLVAFSVGTTPEPAGFYVPPASGQHYVVVSSEGESSAGHYELTIQVDNNQPVAIVTVDPNAATMTTGTTLPLKATITDASGAQLFRDVIWTSSNTSVATVDAYGVVTGVSEGVATITAESEGVTGKSDISVINAPTADITSVGLGVNFTCATRDDLSTFCWGDNRNGQLGDGSASGTQSLVPTQVTGAHNFLSVAADGAGGSSGVGYFACGINADPNGNILCWGENNLGQLGDGTNFAAFGPVPLSGGRIYTSVETGSRHACAIQASGQMFCWGDDNFGKLGTGNSGSSNVPLALTDGNLYSSVSLGTEHGCALLSNDGSAWCFGFGGYGELGDGLQSNHSIPTLVDPSLLFDQISAGYSHTCAIDRQGVGWCWGWNNNGQLGNGGSAPDQCLGTQACEDLPVAVNGGRSWIDISAGSRFTCGIDSSHGLFCWGQNTSGKIGLDPAAVSETNIPTQIATTILFDDVEAGRDHACAIAQDGDVYCWGSNVNGQLGDGTTNDSFQLVRVGLPLQ